MVNKPFWQISDLVLASYTFGCVKMSDFVPNNRHLRNVLIFFFHSKKMAAEAHWKLQKNYGDAAVCETRFRSWFRRFKDGDFDVDDRPREGRPKTFEDADFIKYELLKPNPDISPSDYYFFVSMAHGLADQQFGSFEEIEKCLDSWIASKDKHFYRNGIRALPERWEKVAANDGQYFEWFICDHFFTIKLLFH